MWCFYSEMQKLRLQSGLVRQLQVQFLLYGTTSNRDKSGAYLFLPGKEGGQVRPEPGSSLSLSLSLCPLVHCECLSPSCSSTSPQNLPWSGSPEVRSSLTSLPVSDTSHTESDCTTWTVRRPQINHSPGFCLSGSVCPVLSVQFCLSSSVCPVLSARFCLSGSVCPVLSVRLCLSGSFCQDVYRQPGSVCQVLSVRFCLSSSVCPVLSVRMCTGSPVLSVRFWLLLSYLWYDFVCRRRWSVHPEIR